MVYPNLKFPKLDDRPFFYTNLVATVDGKVQVLENTQDYWPLGSKIDYETLLDLRASADILIHGRKTANKKTVQTLQSENFLEKRKKLNKTSPLFYMVMSTHPDKELVEDLKISSVKHFIVTINNAKLSKDAEDVANIIRLGNEKVDLTLLKEFLFDKGFKNILVEGGPHIMDDFFESKLIDEIFLTIAPKIVGGNRDNTITMVEGNLLAANKINLKIISSKKIENEIYLRYRVNYNE